MGATQSYIPAEAALTTVAVAGAIAFGYAQVKNTTTSSSNIAKPSDASSSSGSSKKGKKKKRADGSAESKTEERTTPSQSLLGSASVNVNDSTPVVVGFPKVIPGEFNSGAVGTSDKDGKKEATSESKTKKKAKKNKKSKAKTAITATADGSVATISSVPPSSDIRSDASSEDADANVSLSRTRQSVTITSASTSPPRPLSRPHKQSTTSIDTDGSWTRVETRRGKRRNAPAPITTSIPTADPSSSFSMSHSAVDPTTSDAGITTSVTTGNSSPVAERATEEDEDEGEPFLASIAREGPSENRKTLAEKLLPKPRKTGVEDMTETPDHPQLARVMRVQPRPDEKPASGFSWGDYEDVQIDASGTGGGGNDADGEDDGWGVVRRSRPKRKPTDQTSSIPQKAPETMTKRQRQNANRHAAEKAAKAEAEADRLARLAKHKSELERVRMNEQLAGRK